MVKMIWTPKAICKVFIYWSRKIKYDLGTILDGFFKISAYYVITKREMAGIALNPLFFEQHLAELQHQ